MTKLDVTCGNFYHGQGISKAELINIYKAKASFAVPTHERVVLSFPPGGSISLSMNEFLETCKPFVEHPPKGAVCACTTEGGITYALFADGKGGLHPAWPLDAYTSFSSVNYETVKIIK